MYSAVENINIYLKTCRVVLPNQLSIHDIKLVTVRIKTQRRFPYKVSCASFSFAC